MNSKTQPIFQRIIASILDGIESGLYRRGETIPSEPELCKQFDTTRMTVRRAIDALVNDGWLYRIQGKGTFVSQFELGRTYQKQGFTSNMLSLGTVPSSQVLFSGECNAETTVRRGLELSPEDSLFCLMRVRLADDQPIALERVWLSLARYPKLPDYDFSAESLYECLKRDYGVEIGYSRQRINAVTIVGKDAEQLFQAKRGVALRIRNIDYDKTMRPIAAADTIYHGAKYTMDVVF